MLYRLRMFFDFLSILLTLDTRFFCPCESILGIFNSYKLEPEKLSLIPTTERGSKNDHLRQRFRVCKLARNRKGVRLSDVLCRSVLCLAKRNKRKPKRTVERILSQRTKSFSRFSQNARKKSGVNERQTEKGS